MFPGKGGRDGLGWGIGILQLSIATLLSWTPSVWQVEVDLKVYVLLILPKRKQTLVQIAFPNEFPIAIFAFSRLIVQPVVFVQKGREAVWKPWSLQAAPSWKPGHSWFGTLLTRNVLTARKSCVRKTPVEVVRAGPASRLLLCPVPWPDLCALHLVLP